MGRAVNGRQGKLTPEWRRTGVRKGESRVIRGFVTGVLWGGLVAVICGVLVGICRVEGRIGNTLMVAAVVASLAIYDVIDSSWSASFYRKGGLSWGQDFLRYQAYAAPTYLLGGVIVLAFYGIWTLYADRGFFLVPGLVAIILYMVFLAIYWAIRGIESSLDWDRPGTPLQRFLASSNTRIAMSMLQILGAAIVVAAISLGLPSP